MNRWQKSHVGILNRGGVDNVIEKMKMCGLSMIKQSIKLILFLAEIAIGIAKIILLLFGLLLKLFMTLIKMGTP